MFSKADFMSSVLLTAEYSVLPPPSRNDMVSKDEVLRGGLTARFTTPQSWQKPLLRPRTCQVHPRPTLIITINIIAKATAERESGDEQST